MFKKKFFSTILAASILSTLLPMSMASAAKNTISNYSGTDETTLFSEDFEGYENITNFKATYTRNSETVFDLADGGVYHQAGSSSNFIFDSYNGSTALNLQSGQSSQTRRIAFAVPSDKRMDSGVVHTVFYMQPRNYDTSKVQKANVFAYSAQNYTSESGASNCFQLFNYSEQANYSGHWLKFDLYVDFDNSKYYLSVYDVSDSYKRIKEKSASMSLSNFGGISVQLKGQVSDPAWSTYCPLFDDVYIGALNNGGNLDTTDFEETVSSNPNVLTEGGWIFSSGAGNITEEDGTKSLAYGWKPGSDMSAGTGNAKNGASGFFIPPEYSKKYGTYNFKFKWCIGTNYNTETVMLFPASTTSLPSSNGSGAIMTLKTTDSSPVEMGMWYDCNVTVDLDAQKWYFVMKTDSGNVKKNTSGNYNYSTLGCIVFMDRFNNSQNTTQSSSKATSFFSRIDDFTAHRYDCPEVYLDINDGEVTATAQNKNYTSADKSARLLVAAYDSDDNLIKVSSQRQTIGKDTKYNPVVNEASMSCQDGAVKYRAFLWDDADTKINYMFPVTEISAN